MIVFKVIVITFLYSWAVVMMVTAFREIPKAKNVFSVVLKIMSFIFFGAVILAGTILWIFGAAEIFPVTVCQFLALGECIGLISYGLSYKTNQKERKGKNETGRISL